MNWYLADIVLENRIESDRRRVVHVNIILLKARSAQLAFDKATKIGRGYQITYKNTVGKRVWVKFRGINQLTTVAEKLADGVELRYSEMVLTSEKKLKNLVSPKSKLAVFSKRRKPTESDPNYGPQEVFSKLLKMGFKKSDIYRATG